MISQGNIDDQQQWSNQFQEELIRYITAEELVLYPSFQKYLHKEGEKMVDQSRHEHEHVSHKFSFFFFISF